MRHTLFALLIAAPLFSWNSHADVVGRWGNYRQGAGVVVFAPLRQDGNSITFGQALGGWFRDQWTGSVGGGYRALWSHKVAWGANAFFDVSDAR